MGVQEFGAQRHPVAQGVGREKRLNSPVFALTKRWRPSSKRRRCVFEAAAKNLKASTR